MTDFEPYVDAPAERRPPPRLARLRPALSWLAGLLVLIALAFTWITGSGSEDPSLNVPADQLTPSAPAADPGAVPADPAATPPP